MSESKAIYKIVDKYVKGLEAEKFTVETLDGSKKATASYEDTVKLARLGKILDVEAIIDTVNQTYVLIFKNGITNVPVHKSIELNMICRIINDEGKCVGYKVQDTKGKNYKITLNKAWELAKDGCINNVSAKIISNKRAIIGEDTFKLCSLPSLNE